MRHIMMTPVRRLDRLSSERQNVICSNCGTANEDGRKFCKECASPLAVLCSNCGTANTPDAKFCGECASPLGGVTATAASSVPGGRAAATPLPNQVAERRMVTVLFARSEERRVGKECRPRWSQE